MVVKIDWSLFQVHVVDAQPDLPPLKDFFKSGSHMVYMISFVQFYYQLKFSHYMNVLPKFQCILKSHFYLRPTPFSSRNMQLKK